MSEKKLKVTNDSVIILDKELRKNIDKANLSAGFVASFTKSPADSIMSKYVEPLCKRSDSIFARRGNLLHSIMESLFRIPQEERIKIWESELDARAKGSTDSLFTKAINQIAIDGIRSKREFFDLLANEDDKEWLKNQLLHYRNMDNNGFTDKVPELFVNGKSSLGIEIFVSGKIGESTRRTVGFIDNTREGEDGIIITDWKTGAFTPYDPNKPISDDNPFDYYRQQICYTMLLEQSNIMVDSACLMYLKPDPPVIADVDIFSPTARQQTVKDFESADKELTECIENGYKFPFRKTKYNNWGTYLLGIGNAFAPDIYTDKFNEIADLSEIQSDIFVM